MTPPDFPTDLPTPPPDLPLEPMTSYFGSGTPVLPSKTAATGDMDSIGVSVLPQWSISSGGSKEDPDAPAAHGPAAMYRLNRVIGLGGMGEVWEATQTSLERRVAVKRIRLERVDPSRVARAEHDFRQEALMSARLEHPNIVPVHDFGRDERGHPLMAMKLVRGRKWSDLVMEEFNALPHAEYAARQVSILIGVAQAVAFAHSRGVVHRDLKPTQVMVGEFGEVLLMDWGLAMVHDPAALGPSAEEAALRLPTRITASSPSGTVAFMAPEQTLLTAELVGPWTDVYLLGGTLFYVLTGHPPHEGNDARQTFFKAATGEHRDPREVAPDRQIPDALAAIVMRATAPRREDRYPSATEFLEALRDWLTGASRRREAEILAAEAATRLGAEGPATYERLNDVGVLLERARILAPESPEIEALAQRAAKEHALLALHQNDLSLARQIAQRAAAGAERDGLAQRIGEAQRRQAARERQRRMLARGVSLLAALLLGGLALYTVQTRETNRTLERQRAEAEAARDTAERQSREALQRSRDTLRLSFFMLRDLRDNLDLEDPADLALRDRVAAEVLRYLRSIDLANATRDAVSEHVKALSDVADIFSELGLYDDARGLVAEGLCLLDERVGAVDMARRALLYRLTEIERRAGNWDAARDAALLAMAGIGSDTEGLDLKSGILFELADIESQLGEYEDAAVTSGEALRLAVGSGQDRDPASMSLSLNNHAVALMSIGDALASEALLETAIRLARTAGTQSHEALGSALGNYGLLLSQTGRPVEGLAALRQGLHHTIQQFGPVHAETGIVTNNVGLAMMNAGDVEGSVAYFLRALEIDAASLPPVHPNIPPHHNNLASAYEALGRSEEALAEYRKGLAIQEQLTGRGSGDTQNLVGNIALLLHRTGRRRDAADLMAEYRMGERVSLAADPMHVFFVTTGADIQLSTHRYAEAEDTLADTYRQARQLFGDADPRTTEIASRLTDILQEYGLSRLALEIAERHLAAMDSEPGYPETAPGRAILLTDIGALAGSLGDREKRKAAEARLFAMLGLPECEDALRAMILVRKAEAAGRERRQDLVRQHCEEAIAIAGQNAMWRQRERAALTSLGRFELNFGSIGRAEELFRRAAATVPEDPLARAEALEPRVVIAHALAMQGCRAEAEAELDAIDRIIAENADDPRLAATEDTAALVRLYLEATAP